ncbi:MAG: hypothetical protein HYX87_03395 [Chloroflexi bacterium]|nr:hypothetical protein [Chloroflexota bacterium]
MVSTSNEARTEKTVCMLCFQVCGINANVLTALEPRDPVTGYPELKALACRIKKARPTSRP